MSFDYLTRRKRFSTKAIKRNCLCF